MVGPTRFTVEQPAPTFTGLQWRGNQTSSGASSANVVLTKPAGLIVGDLMVATWTTGVALVGDVVSTKPSAGWATAGQTFSTEGENLFWSWKIADAADVAAASYTWVMSAARVYHGNIHRYSGHDPTTPINQSSLKNDAAATTHTTNSITPSVANTLIVGYFTLGSGTAVWTLDASLTQRYNATLQSLPTAYGDVIQASTSAVTKTSTNSGSSNTSAMLILAIAPVPAAGGAAALRRALLGVGV